MPIVADDEGFQDKINRLKNAQKKEDDSKSKDEGKKGGTRHQCLI